MKKSLYLISFFVIFNNYKIIYSIMPSNRNISIFIDCGTESINKSLNSSDEIGKGLGAISMTFLNVLNQEPGPILVSDSVISNILGHRTIFNDFLSLSLTALYQKYSKYAQFKDQEFTKNFSLICRYYNKLYNELSEIIKTNNSKNAIIKKLYKDPVFDKSNAPQALQNDESIKSNMVGYLMSYKLPLERYIVKKLTLSSSQVKMYLFIPLSYIRSLSSDYNHTKTNQVKPVNAPLDNMEKVLGLKFNHYPDVDLNVIPDFVEQEAACQQILMNILNNIFVSRTEDPNAFNVWAIIIQGHGIYDQETVEYIKKLQIEKQKYDAELLQEKIQLNKLLMQQKKAPKDRFIIENIQSTKFNLNQIQLDIKSVQNAINQNYDQNIIVGLQGSQFAKVLKFFNNKIFTGFVFYSSCYAGGQHFIDPYKEATTGTPISLNYAIASDTLSEVSTIVYFPRLYLGWFTDYDQQYVIEFDKLVDLKNKKIIFYSNYDFKAYFNALKQESKELLSYKKIFSYVSSFNQDFMKKSGTSVGLASIPSIRFPGVPWFSVIDYDNYLIALTNVKILIQNNQPLKINYGQKVSKAILLYKDTIPFTLDIGKKSANMSFPSIVSMLPGKAKHSFENIYAPGYTFTEIINGFYPFKDLGSSKLFLIKKITAINDLAFSRSKAAATFENVAFILNGRISPDTDLTNIINFQLAGNWYNSNWPRDNAVPNNIAKNFNKVLKNNTPELLKYFNDVKEPEIKGMFTGVVTTTQGQEKVSINPIAKALQEKLKLMQNPELKEQFLESKVFKEAPPEPKKVPAVKQKPAVPIKPVAPVVKPAAPVKPIAPVVKPVAPIVKPAAPVVKLAVPVKPVAPVAKPAAPVVKKPIATIVKPAAPVIKKPVAPVKRKPAPAKRRPAPVKRRPAPAKRRPAAPVKKKPSVPVKKPVAPAKRK